MTLRVVAAAVRDVDGTVFAFAPPARHHTITHWMHENGRPQVEGTQQGFLLSDGRFARRKAAFIIAKAAGQLIRPATGGYQGPELYSEDLW